MAWSIVLIGLMNAGFALPPNFQATWVRSRDKCTSDWMNLVHPIIRNHVAGSTRSTSSSVVSTLFVRTFEVYYAHVSS